MSLFFAGALPVDEPVGDVEDVKKVAGSRWERVADGMVEQRYQKL